MLVNSARSLLKSWDVHQAYYWDLPYLQTTCFSFINWTWTSTGSSRISMISSIASNYIYISLPKSTKKVLTILHHGGPRIFVYIYKDVKWMFLKEYIALWTASPKLPTFIHISYKTWPYVGKRSNMLCLKAARVRIRFVSFCHLIYELVICFTIQKSMVAPVSGESKPYPNTS